MRRLDVKIHERPSAIAQPTDWKDPTFSDAAVVTIAWDDGKLLRKIRKLLTDWWNEEGRLPTVVCGGDWWKDQVGELHFPEFLNGKPWRFPSRGVAIRMDCDLGEFNLHIVPVKFLSYVAIHEREPEMHHSRAQWLPCS